MKRRGRSGEKKEPPKKKKDKGGMGGKGGEKKGAKIAIYSTGGKKKELTKKKCKGKEGLWKKRSKTEAIRYERKRVVQPSLSREAEIDLTKDLESRKRKQKKNHPLGRKKEEPSRRSRMDLVAAILTE